MERDQASKFINDLLKLMVSRGGSSLRDFVASDGASGYFQLDCCVYGRAGQPCHVCGEPVRTLRQASRLRRLRHRRTGDFVRSRFLDGRPRWRACPVG